MTTGQQYFIDHIGEMTGKVLDNWFPRIVGTGCDCCDVRRIQNSLDSWDSWPRLWEETGDMHYKLAEEHMGEGYGLSAGNAYRRASISYHFGSFMLFDKPEEKERIHKKCVEAYGKALPLLKYPGRRVEIPFEGSSMPAYYRQGPDANGRLVLVWPGADAIKEEMSYYDEIFLERGISTLTIDGPGQGEMQGRGVYFRIERFDKATKVAVDYINNVLGYGKLGVFGISLGGFLAMRSAAVAPDSFKAASGSGGGFDIMRSKSIYAAGPMFPADFSCVMGANSLEELESMDFGMNLDDVIQNITCPILVSHGDSDPITPPEGAVKIVKEAVNSKDARLIMVKGGNHVVNSHTYMYRPQTGDFMVKYLV